MRVLKDLEGVVCTTAQLAELLHVSTVHVGLLAKQNVLKRESAGRWLLLENVRNFVEHQQQSRRHDTSDALTAVRKAQLEKLELANKQRSRELIPMSDALFAIDTVCGVMRASIGGLPARASRDLSTQRAVEKSVDEVLNEISDAFGRAAAALRDGGDIDAVARQIHASVGASR